MANILSNIPPSAMEIVGPNECPKPKTCESRHTLRAPATCHPGPHGPSPRLSSSQYCVHGSGSADPLPVIQKYRYRGIRWPMPTRPPPGCRDVQTARTQLTMHAAARVSRDGPARELRLLSLHDAFVHTSLLHIAPVPLSLPSMARAAVRRGGAPSRSRSPEGAHAHR